MTVHDYYNRYYASHELDLDEHGNTFAKIADLLQENKPKMTILDCGCGAGSVSEKLVKRGHDVYGLDIIEEAVKRASYRGIDARIHDLNNGIPFDNEMFDCVLALDILEHVFDPSALLGEIARVLKHDGYIIATIPLHFDLIQRLRILFGMGILSYEHKFYDPTLKAWHYYHLRFFTLSEALSLFKENGFIIEARKFRSMARNAVRPKLLSYFLLSISNRYSVKIFPSLLASGIIARARKRNLK